MERRLLDIDELATRYGFPKWTIRSYCSQGKIPFVKVGRRVYFRVDEIEQWLDEHARPATAEVSAR
jgi:excisionase family DNA binding protein